MAFFLVALVVAVAVFLFWRDRPKRSAPPRVVRIPDSVARNPGDDRAERDWLTDPANPLSPLHPMHWE